MVKEKKIEDLIISISSLINEANSERKLLKEIENNIKGFDIQKNSFEKNDIKKIPSFKSLNDLNDEKKFQQYDWNNIEFEKKEVKESKKNLELKISKLFKEEMKNWINENLKTIIQIELNKFSDKIISEKLK
tara:strand:+ start:656 stop:1051 length:396 start_codon:yes stop_codon:yes gene_type:complete